MASNYHLDEDAGSGAIASARDNMKVFCGVSVDWQERMDPELVRSSRREFRIAYDRIAEHETEREMKSALASLALHS